MLLVAMLLASVRRNHHECFAKQRGVLSEQELSSQDARRQIFPPDSIRCLAVTADQSASPPKRIVLVCFVSEAALHTQGAFSSELDSARLAASYMSQFASISAHFPTPRRSRFRVFQINIIKLVAQCLSSPDTRDRDKA